MKTKIKTKQLMQIINPIKDGILYNEELVKINLKVLEEYVLKPKSKKVFAKSINNEINLYKNLALYIINSESKKIINIDLDDKNIVKEGLFEFIKSIYNKEEELLVELPEYGDNQLLIKSKSLQPISNKIEVDIAKDIHLASLSSVFLENKNLNKPNKNKIVDNQKFFWKESNQDLFTDKDFLFNKISQILQEKNFIEKTFYDLIEQANNTYVLSDSFKLDLLNLNNKKLNTLLINSQDNASNKFKIDFFQPVFKEFLENKVKEGKFHLLESLFVYSKSNQKNIEKLSEFINMEETINYFKANDLVQFDNSIVFSFKNCYEFLSPEKKIREDIVKLYIKSITQKTINNEVFLDDTKLFKMPIEVFQNEYILKELTPYLNFSKLAKFLKENKVSSSYLENKQNLLQSFYLSDYRVISWANNFIPKEEINKELMLEIVSEKTKVLEIISSQPTELKNFTHFLYDIDVLYTAYQKGLRISDIKLEWIKEDLIKMNPNKDIEYFKRKYVISNKLLGKSPIFMKYNEEDFIKFKEKYIKLEYVYLKVDNFLSSYPNRESLGLSKITNSQEVIDLLNNIKDLNLTYYEFDAKNFYKDLNNKLKNNLEIVKEILTLGNLNFSELSESLQYNKNLAIQFIAKDRESIELIPVEFFNDIKFSLDFVKLIDEAVIDVEDAPLFIQKFFDNQQITENYYENLNRYISYFDLQDNIQTSSLKSKKNKI